MHTPYLGGEGKALLATFGLFSFGKMELKCTLLLVQSAKKILRAKQRFATFVNVCRCLPTFANVVDAFACVHIHTFLKVGE